MYYWGGGGGKRVNERAIQGGMLKERDWLKGVFGIVFDSVQCKINLHKEKWTQDSHDLHVP